MHPAMPHPAVVEAYYKDYLKEFPALLTAAWGFTVETATQGMRMVLSGVFEQYPRLKIILGHLGEGLPFSLWRIDMALATPGQPRDRVPRYVPRALLDHDQRQLLDRRRCSARVLEMGADRILFSVDYPFVPQSPGVKWMQDIPFGPEDREKIYSGNAQRLLKM